jgi:hypothetical protein
MMRRVVRRAVHALGPLPWSSRLNLAGVPVRPAPRATLTGTSAASFASGPAPTPFSFLTAGMIEIRAAPKAGFV